MLDVFIQDLSPEHANRMSIQDFNKPSKDEIPAFQLTDSLTLCKIPSFQTTNGFER